nr:DUF6103 family protein [uncultured Oscillibacter sp.]
MEKREIIVTFDNVRLDALEFYLKKENTSIQKRMDEALRQLYESTVPEAVREYLDSRAAPPAKSKRPSRPPSPGKIPAKAAGQAADAAKEEVTE